METDKVRILMAEKIDLFKQYHEATEELKLGIQGGDDRQVMTLLKKRHQIINQVERIDRTIGPKFTEKDHKNPEAMRQLLNNISSIENECINLVETERGNMKQAVLERRMNQKRQARYGTSGEAPARYIDTRVR